MFTFPYTSGYLLPPWAVNGSAYWMLYQLHPIESFLWFLFYFSFSSQIIKSRFTQYGILQISFDLLNHWLITILQARTSCSCYFFKMHIISLPILFSHLRGLLLVFLNLWPWSGYLSVFWWFEEDNYVELGVETHSFD